VGVRVGRCEVCEANRKKEKQRSERESESQSEKEKEIASRKVCREISRKKMSKNAPKNSSAIKRPTSKKEREKRKNRELQKKCGDDERYLRVGKCNEHAGEKKKGGFEHTCIGCLLCDSRFCSPGNCCTLRKVSFGCLVSLQVAKRN
jgi:hypothetical protein